MVVLVCRVSDDWRKKKNFLSDMSDTLVRTVQTK